MNVQNGLAILDTGASRSVIGADNVPAVLQKLPTNVQKLVREKPSKIGFRFGNDQIAYSFKQLQIPLVHGKLRIWLLVEVVPKATPFLLSIKAMKSLGAVIDLVHESCFLQTIQRSLPLRENANGLFVIDVADLCQSSQPELEAVHVTSSLSQLQPPPGLCLPDAKHHAESPGDSGGIPRFGGRDLGESSSALHNAVHHDEGRVTGGSGVGSRDASDSSAGGGSQEPERKDYGTGPADCPANPDEEPADQSKPLHQWTTVRYLGGHRNGEYQHDPKRRSTRTQPSCTGPKYFHANSFGTPDMWWEEEHESCRNQYIWKPVSDLSRPTDGSSSSSCDSREQCSSSVAYSSRSGHLGTEGHHMGEKCKGDSYVATYEQDPSYVKWILARVDSLNEVMEDFANYCITRRRLEEVARQQIVN